MAATLDAAAQTAAMEAVQRRLSEQVQGIQRALRGAAASPQAVAALVEEIGSRTQTLLTMRSDLDVLHRRLRSLRRALQQQYPWAFEEGAGEGSTSAPHARPATLESVAGQVAQDAVEAWAREAAWNWRGQPTGM